MSLNPRQKRFAELYHRYGNGTRAYGEAGEVEKTEDGNFPAGSLVIGFDEEIAVEYNDRMVVTTFIIY